MISSWLRASSAERGAPSLAPQHGAIALRDWAEGLVGGHRLDQFVIVVGVLALVGLFHLEQINSVHPAPVRTNLHVAEQGIVKRRLLHLRYGIFGIVAA